MNLTFPRSELKTAIQGLSRIVPKRSSLPVLQSVRFAADGGAVTVSATDLDKTATYCFENAAQAGSSEPFLVELQQLVPLAKGSGADPIELEALPEHQVAITNRVAGQSIRRKIATQDPADYPPAPMDIPVKPVDAVFLDYFRKTAVFASTDESRGAIQGVYLEVSDKKGHVLVGTDGRRLTALNTLVLPIEKSLVVPVGKFLLWKGLSGDLSIGAKANSNALWFRLATPRWTYTSRTLDAVYPNWRQVMPSGEGAHTVTFSQEDVALLRKALPGFPGHDRSDGLVRLTGKDGRLTLSCKGKDENVWAELELKGSTCDGKPFQIGLCRWYLLDALEAGFRSFSLMGQEGPVFSSDGNGGTHVLMPIQLLPEAPAAQTNPEPMGAVADENGVVWTLTDAVK